MAKLEFKLTRDTLFKVFFVKYPDLLKSLVTQALGIDINDVMDFRITNPNIPSNIVGEKFCELDIKMELDGETVNLEVQVDDEGDYPERSLYYWVRCYSSALHTSEEYIELPRTIAINIVAFNMFKDTKDFHSEFRVLEVTRHTELTDKMSLHYFELKKLPKLAESDAGNILKLWLALFNAETEEEMLKIAKIGGEIMEQAVQGYKNVLVSKDFEELERLRERARNNERAALGRARRENSMEIAKKLKAEGVSIDIIQKSTKLDIDVIQKI
jgi:predicted transposase/invertase (TIGR01784 family)